MQIKGMFFFRTKNLYIPEKCCIFAVGKKVMVIGDWLLVIGYWLLFF